MAIYFVFPVICLIANFVTQTKRKGIPMLVLLSFLCSFLCMGYMTGSDWRTYETEFYAIGMSYNHFEIGYTVLSTFFAAFDWDFWHFWIFLKVLIFIAICFVSNKFFRNFWLGMGIFLYYAYPIFIDDPMRHSLGMAIFWLAVFFFESKRFCLFVLFCALSVLFHKAMIICILLFGMFIPISRPIHLFFIWLASMIVFSSTDVILSVTLFIINFTGQSQYLEYFSNSEGYYAGGRFLSIHLVANSLFFLVLLAHANKLSRLNFHSEMLLRLSLIFIVCLRLSTSVMMLQRFVLVFSPFFCWTLAELSSCFSPKKKAVFVLVLYFFTFYYMAQKLYDYRYLPYSNYVISILCEPKQSYEFRSSFNKRLWRQ